MGNTWKVYWKYLEGIWGIPGRYIGNTWKVYWEYLEGILEIPGRYMGEYLEGILGIPGRYMDFERIRNFLNSKAPILQKSNK